MAAIGQGLFRRVLGHNSLLVLDGEEHLRQRRLLLPPFHGDHVADHRQAMSEAAERHVATWPGGTPFALQPSMQAMTLDVILHLVFGLAPGPRRDRLRKLLARLLELNATLGHGAPPAAGRPRRALAVGPAHALHRGRRRGPLRRDRAASRGVAGGQRRRALAAFRPERFLEGQPPSYAWIPFGGGVRRCIGASFALVEMQAVMRAVLERVDLAPASGRDERVVRRAFTLSPANGARVVVTRRWTDGGRRVA